MDTHDPYRAPSPPALPVQVPSGPLDMAGVAFGSAPATAATIAAGYSLSIVGRRWLASMIDTVALLVLLMGPYLLFGKAFAEKTLVVWLLLAAAYFPVMETLCGGALGKLATGTRVVTLSGGRPAWWQSIVRTLLRLLEVNPLLFGGVPAGIVAMASARRQRVGDMLAGTYVLLREDVERIAPAPVRGRRPPPLPMP